MRVAARARATRLRVCVRVCYARVWCTRDTGRNRISRKIASHRETARRYPRRTPHPTFRRATRADAITMSVESVTSDKQPPPPPPTATITATATTVATTTTTAAATATTTAAAKKEEGTSRQHYFASRFRGGESPEISEITSRVRLGRRSLSFRFLSLSLSLVERYTLRENENTKGDETEFGTSGCLLG